MENIGIIVYNYSLLGGVQKVTLFLSQLFYDNKLPIKCIISIEDGNQVHYPYPKELNIYVVNSNLNKINEIIINEKIGNCIVQIEDLVFSSRVINLISNTGCKIFPVLHSSPYWWLKKYYSIKECLAHPIYFLQYIKMAVYWRPLHTRLLKSLLEYNIICVSKQAKVELCNYLKLNKNSNKVSYIYNPIPFKELSDENKRNIIVFAGRLAIEKRPLLMLKVWSKVYKKYRDWEFYILGDGDYKDKMTKYIHKHHIKNIQLLGKVDNVYEFMKMSKITILFSKYEGLPTTLLEASMCKNALLVTEGDGGIIDIVENGVNGYIVPPSNFDEIVKKLQMLMDKNGKLAIQLGKRSYMNLSKFSYNYIIKQWISILK